MTMKNFNKKYFETTTLIYYNDDITTIINHINKQIDKLNTDRYTFTAREIYDKLYKLSKKYYHMIEQNNTDDGLTGVRLANVHHGERSKKNIIRKAKIITLFKLIGDIFGSQIYDSDIHDPNIIDICEMTFERFCEEIIDEYNSSHEECLKDMLKDYVIILNNMLTCEWDETIFSEQYIKEKYNYDFGPMCCLFKKHAFDSDSEEDSTSEENTYFGPKKCAFDSDSEENNYYKDDEEYQQLFAMANESDSDSSSGDDCDDQNDKWLANMEREHAREKLQNKLEEDLEDQEWNLRNNGPDIYKFI